MDNKIEMTLQCPKCSSSVSLKTQKNGEILISWSVPIDTDKIQDLLIDQIRDVTLNLRGGGTINIKCYNK